MEVIVPILGDIVVTANVNHFPGFFVLFCVCSSSLTDCSIHICLTSAVYFDGFGALR